MQKSRQQIELSLIDLNTGQLEWLPSNPRQWTKEDLDNTTESIKRDPDFLEDRPLLLTPNGERFVVFGGNLRSRACIEAKVQSAPAYVYIPETEKDFETIKRRAMLDNGSFGSWDFDALGNEWSDLPLTKWGVPAWNTPGADPQKKEAEEDDFNEKSDKIETRCQAGDIWALGNHRLKCGDATKAEDLDDLMAGEHVDLYLTDPPYNVDYVGKTEDALKIQNDHMADNSFREFLTDSFQNACRAMNPGASYYIWHADSEGFNFRYAVRAAGLPLKQCLIWNKNQLVMGRQDYQWKHEPCLYGWKEGASHHWFSVRKQTTILSFDKPVRNGEHPTMKPVTLFAYLIQNSCAEGGGVLDTFGGSGTTLIAAEQLNRKCYIMELDPHYCDVIIARWEKLTGKTAEKI